MKLLWRISKYADLQGIGGTLFAARWHNAGLPIVYLGESPATALLETLVHLDIKSPAKLPIDYRWLRVMVPDDIPAPSVDPASLPSGWAANEAATRAIGDRWLRDKSSALLRVPSALTPDTFNVLLNPSHPDAARIALAGSTLVTFDPRLVKGVSSPPRKPSPKRATRKPKPKTKR